MSSSMGKNRQPKASEFQENLEILRQIQFFSGLSLEALKVIAYLCVRETFKPGDYLFHKDDNDGKAFYIVSGKAGVWREDEGGESPQEKYVEGEFIGSLALLSDMRRLFSLKALTDMTCLILSRDKFAKVMEQFPDLMPKVLKSVVDSVLAWEERLLIDQNGFCEACRQKAGVSLI